ncbi:hypothetical protein IWQ62_006545 [Dispira parvispora]|uniref:Mediator of RNA polymerase II transcription subunit 9 n=1 Tax=Dispira parvispora TaxID=1520584 RepID=A0A9W8E477_9FUNG|nr:hypothetical protein IWQ62_006545 [Dispira parvispora]
MFDIFIDTNASPSPKDDASKMVNLDDFLNAGDTKAIDFSNLVTTQPDPSAAPTVPQGTARHSTTTKAALNSEEPVSPDTVWEVTGLDPTDFNLLPGVARIMELLVSGEDRPEIARQVARLYDQLDRCEASVKALPGAEWSTQQQEQWLQREKLALQKKLGQMEKYLALPAFVPSKGDD